ncbi:hypothetical protein QBC47DRAFT_336342 [Echria macrotheca]|uniref:Rhodopsin domain-containing protein n=1 Tax=Echria macrotheca TaxID=438768 RepID=A0AAJ0BL40_9PEZI|nr:hypothetical protein QBC47DRAFT_336342 [Echria macrotheca]
MADDRSQDLVIPLCAMAAVSFGFLVLRFLCKIKYNKQLVLDDYLLAVSWAFLVAYTTTSILATKNGLGRHLASLSQTEIINTHRLMAVSSFLNLAAITTSKTSFCITLIRLAFDIWQRRLIWGAIITINIFMWMTAIFIFTSCSPIDKIWDSSVPGTCVNRHMLLGFNVFSGAWSASMDFFLALFPWYLIWGLNMRRVEKLGVCIAMSLGILSGATGVMKTVYIEGSASWRDWTYRSIDLLIWASAEAATIIVAASIPFLRSALKRLTGSRGSNAAGSRAYRLPHISNGNPTPNPHLDVPQVSASGLPLPKGRNTDDESDVCILIQGKEEAQDLSTSTLDLERGQ